jgi:hypothetical protein
MHVRYCSAYSYSCTAIQRRHVMLEHMRRHCLVVTNTGLFDEHGNAVKQYDFKYTLPFKTGPGTFEEAAVCGNAFSKAFGLGKNTRTEYEKIIRTELLRESPHDISTRTLRQADIDCIAFCSDDPNCPSIIIVHFKSLLYAAMPDRAIACHDC